MSEPMPTISTHATNGRFRKGRAAGMIALAAIIFAGGGATGWGVAVIHRPPPPMFGEPPTPRVSDMVSRLREELLLSDDQAAKVKDIYQQRNEALQAIREKMGPQMKAQYDKLNEQMKEVLNPAQFQKWHERFEDGGAGCFRRLHRAVRASRRAIITVPAMIFHRRHQEGARRTMDPRAVRRMACRRREYQVQTI